MKSIKHISIYTAILIIVMIVYGISDFMQKEKFDENMVMVSKSEYTSLSKSVKELAGETNPQQMTAVNTQRMQSKAQKVVENAENLEESRFETSKTEDDLIVTKFYIKVAFSFIFCFVSLFIVLSKRYDEETKKWAYSVLTLIAGVWIGTL